MLTKGSPGDHDFQLPEELSTYFQTVVSLKRDSLGNWPFVGLEDFLMKHGVMFKRGNMPPRRGGWYRRAKQCYRNAYLNAELDVDRFVYCEGFCWRQSGRWFPVRHAWIVDRDAPKLALDSTLDRAVSYDYWGVPIRRTFIEGFVRETHATGPVLEWPERGYPVYSGAFRPCEVIEPVGGVHLPLLPDAKSI